MDGFIKDEDLVSYGEMEKDFFEMDEEEKIIWRLNFVERLKAKIFAKGQALVYKKEGEMIAELEDGTIIPL